VEPGTAASKSAFKPFPIEVSIEERSVVDPSGTITEVTTSTDGVGASAVTVVVNPAVSSAVPNALANVVVSSVEVMTFCATAGSSTVTVTSTLPVRRRRAPPNMRRAWATATFATSTPAVAAYWVLKVSSGISPLPKPTFDDTI
jgi:hypothetical protein